MHVTAMREKAAMDALPLDSRTTMLEKWREGCLWAVVHVTGQPQDSEWTWRNLQLGVWTQHGEYRFVTIFT